MIYGVYICIHYVTVTADRTVGVADPMAALRQVDEYCWHGFFPHDATGDEWVFYMISLTYTLGGSKSMTKPPTPQKHINRDFQKPETMRAVACYFYLWVYRHL